MGQQLRESDTPAGNTQQEQRQPERKPVTSPQEFFAKFEERQRKIVAGQKAVHDSIGHGKRPESLGTAEMLPLDDPSKWVIPTGQANAGQADAPKQAIAQPLSRELSQMWQGHDQQLNELLEKQKNELGNLSTKQSLLRETCGELEKGGAKELDALLKKQRKDVERFFDNNNTREKLQGLYGLSKEQVDALKEARLKEVDEKIAQARKEHAEIYEDAKSYLTVFESAQRRSKLAAEVGIKLPNIFISTNGQQGTPPPSTVHWALWGELYDSTRALGNRGILTSVVGEGSLSINANAALPYGPLHRLIGGEIMKRGIRQQVDDMLVRTSDWSKPFVVSGDELVVITIAKRLAERGIDPSPEAGNIKFKDTQPTDRQWAELKSIYLKAKARDEQQAELQAPVKPFETQSPQAQARMREDQTSSTPGAGGAFGG